MAPDAETSLFERGAGGGVAYERGVAAEPAVFDARRPLLRLLRTRGDFRFGKLRVDRTLRNVDRDFIAILQKPDKSAFRSLGRNVSDAGAVGSAGEASVGDERDRFTEPGADDLGRGS